MGGSRFGRAAIAAGAMVVACGGRAKEPTPTADLAARRDAQDALRPVLRSWARGTREARLATEAKLADVQRRFPNDPMARVAAVHGAWIAVERGQIERAVAIAGPFARGQAGTTRDLALVVEGAALRRQKRPAEALARLEPLVGKLVDAYARALLDEEVVSAAIEARRWGAAFRLMRAWLAEATEEEAPDVRAKVERLLRGIPPDVLAELLDSARGGEETLLQLVAQRVAELAVERGDRTLARRLLAKARGALGDRGDAVAQLAAGVSAARVEARTVGLLLSLRSDETRRRGAEVAAGLAIGLGLDRPGSAARLVSRDDHGSLDGAREALAALSADGAAVVVAGFDAEEAGVVARFAEADRVPVILLRRPEGGSAGPFGFVLGEDPGEVGEALLAALRVGGDDVVWIGEGGAAARVMAAQECGEELAPAAWKKAGVSAFVLTGSPSCARDVQDAARGIGARFAFGVDAGVDAVASARPGALVATAGAFPFAPDAATATEPPSWWAALGRDAGVLAWAGVQALPEKGTEDPAEVRVRRAAAAKALGDAEATLWTTDAKGFAGGRAIARKITVRERR